MLLDLLNRAAMKGNLKRAKNAGRQNIRDTGEVGLGSSRIRNGISTVASMVGALAEGLGQLGEIPRLPSPDLGSETDNIDVLQSLENFSDPTKVQTAGKIIRLAAAEVTKGNQFRENQPIYYKFFNDKSIQPNNNFTVTFGWGDPLTDGSSPRDDGQERKDWIDFYGNMPIVEPWHVKSVSVNVLPTSVEVEKRFTFTFPSVDIKSMDHKFSVVFQEDKIGTIFTFIQWAYAKIISPSGIHYSQSNNRIGWCRINVLNPYTKVMTEFLYQDVFIVSAGQLNLDYSSTAITEYAVDFQAASRIVRTIPIVRKSTDKQAEDQSGSGAPTIGTQQNSQSAED